MLYKFNGKDNIEMMPSYNYEKLGGLEKDLENLLAENLSDLYTADGQLMPIFQERKMQEEPDLCALDKNGNLVIFELKRGDVPKDTTIQIMRYCQTYGQKNYTELCELYKKYLKKTDVDLKIAHKEAFGLDIPLKDDDFNKHQKLILVGSSADSSLLNAIDYWKNNGIDIDYIPYRFYKINKEIYFEFFAKPYDYHIVGSNRGILFDTNKTYDENSIWEMFNENKVSAYGDVKDHVKRFKKGDFVLYYHTGLGIVGAGTIKTGKIKENKEKEEMYMDVDLITPAITSAKDLQSISYSEIRALLNKNFFLARTDKVPYLTTEEAEKIIEKLKEKYQM